MTTTTHSVAPEDIMAWLDGELSASKAQAISLHLDECANCAALENDLRNTSQSLTRWAVPGIPAGVEEFITKAAESEQSYRPIRAPHRNWKLWAIGSGGLTGILAALLIVASLNRPQLQPQPITLKAEQTTRTSEQAESKQFDRLEQFAKIFAPPRTSQRLYEQMGKSKQTDGYQGTVNANSAQLAQPPPRAVKVPPSADRYTGGGLEQLGDGPMAGPPLPAPMIARTVSLLIQVKNVETARVSLDQILARHHGYSAQLNASTAEGAARSLSASLRIPEPELAAALDEIKTLGRIENESQSGEEVTQQHEDLVARLTTSRGTEERLRAILQQRTGKVSDVLEVEEEIARVRGEIESMEAEQKNLEHRVDFATVDIQFTEDYKAPLSSPDNSAGTRIHNSFVAGYRNASDTLLGFLLFFEEFGPTILIWLAVLTLPVLLVWRRYRRLHANL